MHIYINILIYIIFFSKSSWIATNDIKIEMDFHWGLYGQSIEYDGFAGNLQNYRGVEDCVVFHTNSWHDVPCSNSRKIMCEKSSSKLCFHHYLIRKYIYYSVLPLYRLYHTQLK